MMAYHSVSMYIFTHLCTNLHVHLFIISIYIFLSVYLSIHLIYIGHINELQITVTAHACDGLNDPTVAAVNAASYALLLSKQPWFGPIGCVRVGYIDGRYALY